jgi:hypothetical protein
MAPTAKNRPAAAPYAIRRVTSKKNIEKQYKPKPPTRYPHLKLKEPRVRFASTPTTPTTPTTPIINVNDYVTFNDFIKKHSPGDGHCFYHAVLQYIYFTYPKPYAAKIKSIFPIDYDNSNKKPSDVSKLRNAVVQELEKKIDHVYTGITLSKNMVENRIVAQAVSLDNRSVASFGYATNIDFQAVSDFLQICIIVYTPTNNWEIYSPKEKISDIQVDTRNLNIKATRCDPKTIMYIADNGNNHFDNLFLTPDAISETAITLRKSSPIASVRKSSPIASVRKSSPLAMPATIARKSSPVASVRKSSPVAIPVASVRTSPLTKMSPKSKAKELGPKETEAKKWAAKIVEWKYQGSAPRSKIRRGSALQLDPMETEATVEKYIKANKGDQLIALLEEFAGPNNETITPTEIYIRYKRDGYATAKATLEKIYKSLSPSPRKTQRLASGTMLRGTMLRGTVRGSKRGGRKTLKRRK